MRSPEHRRRKVAEREALRWVVRAKSGRMTAVERDQMDQWLLADRANGEAFTYADELWTATDLLGELKDLEPIPPIPVRGGSTSGWRLRWRALAAIAVAATAAVAVMWTTQAPLYATGAGEVRRVTLADGSVLDLSPQTRVRVHFTTNERRLTLESGEALFSVAHNKARPFIVSAGGGDIRAVGTRFDVHRGPEGVTVAVLEGVVEVARQKTPERAVLKVGDQAVYDGPKLTRAKLSDPARADAWRRGYLEYHNETLERVLADANRYSERPLVIKDEALNQLRITAVIKTEAIEDLPENLEKMLPVEAVRTASGPITLRRKDS
jgi:transmembrane sensor